MNIREKKLLEFAMANAENTVKLSEQSQSVIDYNVMMGNLADPEQEENADE